MGAMPAAGTGHGVRGGSLKKQEEIERTVIEFIKKEKLIKEGDVVVTGISGGADSVCLLEVLCHLRTILGIKLAAAHLHHGIRKETASRDMEYVQEFCRERQVPLEIRQSDIPFISKKQGISEEEAGRNARYELFLDVAKRYGSRTIAVAHHKEDQAETVLFRLARGTGLKGLCGMEAKSIRRKSGTREEFQIVRPFLSLSKGDILEYLKETGISYCEDETNKEAFYSRNRIRLEILPLFHEHINPQTSEHIARTAQMLSLVHSFIQENVSILQKEAVIVCDTGGNDVCIDLKRFRKAHQVLQAELLRQTVAKLSGSAKDISNRHIEQMIGLAEGEGRKKISLPYGLSAVLEYDRLRIGRNGGEEKRALCVEIPRLTEQEGIFVWENEQLRMSFQLFLCKDGKAWCRKTGEDYFISQIIQKNDYTKCVDYGKIKNGLFLRYRQAGDEMQIGNAGHHKKLKRLFIDEKVPREQRDCCPILAEGSNVLWIPGLRMGDGCRIDAHTEQVLRISVQFKPTGKS